MAYASGATKLQAYSQAGKLLLSVDSLRGVTSHIHLGDKLIAEVNTQTGTRYSHTDALGSPVATTNASRQVLSRTRYEPYGLTAAGTNPTGIGFTGHVNDADTGLVYMQQRYYEPYAGRFLSVDPVTTDAKSGDLFNRYNYAYNNPYRFKDPDGRFGIAGALAGAAFEAFAQWSVTGSVSDWKADEVTRPLVGYFVRLELGFLAFGAVLGVAYYFAYGPLPAVRMFFGCLAAGNLGLLWVFRKSLLDYLRTLLH